MVDRYSGTLAWDVSGVATTGGALLQQWACAGGAARGFTLTAVA